MAKSKPPQLTLADDKSVSVRTWRKKFDSWCLLQTEWRDTSKDGADPEHWITEYYKCEIAAFYLALPDDVLTVFDTTILPKMTTTEQKQPWSYQDKLEQHFAGQDDVMPQRLAFFNCTQGLTETITDFETRIRSIARKTRYAEMKDPLHELMRDRLCTGVHNKDLRQLLLRHYKNTESQSPYTFDEQLAKAKAWEAAHNTNVAIMQTSTQKSEEQVNYAGQARGQTAPAAARPKFCGWCGGPRHSRKECPATRPGSYCTNCYMTENHLAKMCRSSKDKFKTAFETIKDRSKAVSGVNQVTRPKWRRQPTWQANAVQTLPSDVAEYTQGDGTDYVVHSFTAYSLQDMSAKDDKFFTWLPVSTGPGKTVKVLMQIDSAATCNTLPSTVCEKIANLNQLRPSNSRILPYSGKPIRPLGRQLLACEGAHCFETLSFEVIDAKDIPDKPALLSGKDSERLGLIQFNDTRVFASPTSDVHPPSPHGVTQVYTATTLHDTKDKRRAARAALRPGHITQNQLVTAYPQNFEGLGNVGNPVHITLNSQVSSCHAGIHRLPVAKHDRVKAKLDEMEQADKLVRVEEPTDWCSNMTVREKPLPDGTTKVRICLDPSQTVNKAVIIPHYQIPTTAEIFPRLAGKTYKTFSIFDALDGFTQIKLDHESSLLTTMHTPWGRYRWLRLPYGVSCAPEEFQLRMNEALEGLEGIYCIADDILVVGQGDTREEADINHDQNVIALMQRAEHRNLKLNPRKTQYKLQKIAFMGCVVSEKGTQPDPNKVKAITEMPPPTDKQGVLRFCGMVNYLNNFSPHLSQTIQPLFALTKEDHAFLWSPSHQTAFVAAKQLIAQAPCLAFFDARKHTTLQVDASQGGLGAVLLQPSDTGALQPVAFTSCKMRPNEEKWAQIEKECLAIVSACDKWDQWIFGQEVSVQTDHQPLEIIFKKPLRAAPRRLQKMIMRLQRYKLIVKYKKGSTMLLADTLSRATLPTTNDSKQTNFEVFRIDMEEDNPPTPGLKNQTLHDIKQATAEDPVSHNLVKIITEGWPDHKTLLPPGLSPFWTYRDELTVTDGIVYKGLQVLIPTPLKNTMLHRIHVAHLGPESNIRMCKDILFWPNMKADIQDMCQACGKCAQFRVQNQKEPMSSQPTPQYPWQFVSQDLCCFESGNALVTVDHYSDFIEVDELDNTLASTITARTEAHIARHGVPEVILTDNGPQFTASEYEGLCQRYRIHHITSSPYWPQGNGRAEAAVKVIKRILQKAGKANLQEALLNYRNTPQQGHTLSPSQRSMGRRTRTTLPAARTLLMSEQSAEVQSAINLKKAAAKHYYDRRTGPRLPQVATGDFVYLKPPPHRKAGPWPYGVVTDIPTPHSYRVDTPTGITRRNRTHVHPAAPPPPGSMIPRSWQQHMHMPMASVQPAPAASSQTASNMTTPDSLPLSKPPLCPSPPTEILGPQTETTTQPRQPVRHSLPAAPVITRSGRVSKPVKRMDL